ncbi:hypothetical protein Tco_0731715 [Tanacetum coccineum]
MDNLSHSIGTPLATKPKLDVDLSGEPIDQSDYRSKIGSLMYLTSSRLDLVQAVRCTVAVRGGRHVSTRYCSVDGWTNQRVTRGTLRVSVRGRHVSDYGNNVEVGGRQNDQNTPRSSNISGWRPEMTKLPPPT